MKLREDQIKLQTLLKETITLLCKNSLKSSKGFVIDALIGITTDDASTFLLKLEETVGDVDDDNAESKNGDRDEADRGGSRSSRKRPPDGDTPRTDSKRHRSDDDDCDNASDDDYKDNNDQDRNRDVDANNEESTYYDENDVDDNYDNDTKNENEADGDLMCVKQEQCDDDGQFGETDQSQAEDTAAAGDTTPDDTAPDGSGFDDGSSTCNQSSSTNDPNASGSQQVRDFGISEKLLDVVF